MSKYSIVCNFSDCIIKYNYITWYLEETHLIYLKRTKKKKKTLKQHRKAERNPQ